MDSTRTRQPSVTTHAELLRQKWVACSCYGEDTQPGGSLVWTGKATEGSIVEGILCRECEKVCDRLKNRAGQVDCPFDVCKEDPKETREAAAEWEEWDGWGRGSMD